MLKEKAKIEKIEWSKKVIQQVSPYSRERKWRENVE